MDDHAQTETPTREARRRRVRVGLVAVTTALAAVAAAVALTAGDGTRSGPAPDVGLELFDGTRRTLASYRGRPLVVNFWASWCPPCISEMPAFESVHQASKGEIAFLGINTQDSAEAASTVVERTGVTYDLARDPDAELFAAFKVFGMPTTYFISPDGVILDSNTGALNEDALERKIEEHFE